MPPRRGEVTPPYEIKRIGLHKKDGTQRGVILFLCEEEDYAFSTVILPSESLIWAVSPL